MQNDLKRQLPGLLSVYKAFGPQRFSGDIGDHDEGDHDGHNIQGGEGGDIEGHWGGDIDGHQGGDPGSRNHIFTSQLANAAEMMREWKGSLGEEGSNYGFEDAPDAPSAADLGRFESGA